MTSKCSKLKGKLKALAGVCVPSEKKQFSNLLTNRKWSLANLMTNEAASSDAFFEIDSERNNKKGDTLTPIQIDCLAVQIEWVKTKAIAAALPKLSSRQLQWQVLQQNKSSVFRHFTSRPFLAMKAALEIQIIPPWLRFRNPHYPHYSQPCMLCGKSHPLGCNSICTCHVQRIFVCISAKKQLRFPLSFLLTSP